MLPIFLTPSHLVEKWNRITRAIPLKLDGREPRKPATPTIRTFAELLTLARSAGRRPLVLAGPPRLKLDVEARIARRDESRRLRRDRKRPGRRCLAPAVR